MAPTVKVWFDPEGDFLEVQFSDAPGFMRPTAYEAIMERVDEHGISWDSASSASAVSKKTTLSKPNL